MTGRGVSAHVAMSVFVIAATFSHAATFDVRDWPMPPAASASSQPDLSITPRGDVLLAWTEKTGDGVHALRFSRQATASGSIWSAPRTIAQGSGWFVNWADTPHVLALPDGTLWAHWLRRNGKAVYDYGIALVQSRDDGASWSAPIRIEPEGARNDYGFVAMWARSRGTLGLAWLDSRAKQAPDDAHAAHDHGEGAGRMMLRAATFGADTARSDERMLDASTCDCCTTAAASTSRGPVIVYRGRSDGEIRDTRIVRFEHDRWTVPRDVHADGWRFAGCPVNGPAVAATGNEVWVAWYTEADGAPSLRLARSRDAGDTFDAPTSLANGEGGLGRVALASEGDHVWAAWLAERDGGRDGQQLWLAKLARKDSRVMHAAVVASLAARGRASGLPRLVAHDGTAWLVWTDVVDGATRLRGASVR